MTDAAAAEAIAPWLAVPDAAAAIEYYASAFGAAERYRLEGKGDSVAVAQLGIGPATFWVQSDADASPSGDGDPAVRMIISVAEPQEFFDRAVAAGATEVAPVKEAHGWITGRVRDPFGHDWEFSRQVAASPSQL